MTEQKTAFLRAVRGPIVLIALGVLFVLDQNGSLRFSQTWPALLIVFGAFKLAERMAAPSPAPAPWSSAGTHVGNDPGGVRQ